MAQKFADEMFCHFSTPKQLHSDQGMQFESKLVHDICNLLQQRHKQHCAISSVMEWWRDSIEHSSTSSLQWVGTILLTGNTTPAKLALPTIPVCTPPQGFPHFS